LATWAVDFGVAKYCIWNMANQVDIVKSVVEDSG
jgi:hypothetical protein